MNLVRKAIYGIGWVSLFTLTTRAVRFTTTIILARLLEPTDFGLVAIGLLAINTLALFRSLGISSAIIYRKDNIEKAANTAFTIMPFVGLVLFIFAFLLAPYIADFFNSPESEPVIKFLSISLLLVSLGLTHSNLLDKELEFKKQVLPEVGSILIYGIVSISLAFSGYGVWSIVYGKVSATLMWLIIIWVVSPWRPKLEFDWGVAKELLSYGRHVLGATIILFLLSNVDNGFVGKFLGTTALGFYAIAYTISNTPALNIRALVNRVMFPTYSKLQDNKRVLIRVYLKTIKYISALSVPVSLGILVLAPSLIAVVLGEKWIPALLPLQVLCIAGLFKSIRASTGPLFNAVGRPDIEESLSLYQLVMMCVLIYPLSMWYGILGTSLAVTIPVIIFTLLSYIVVNRLLDIGWKRFVGVLVVPFTASLLMVAVIHLSQILLPDFGLMKLLALVAVGGASYLILIFLLGRELLVEFKNILLTFRA